MRSLPSLAVLLLATACVSEEGFTRAAAAAMCERLDACEDLFEESPAECEDGMGEFLATLTASCASFDAQAAQSCLRELRSATCDEDAFNGDTCAKVWTNCPEPP